MKRYYLFILFAMVFFVSMQQVKAQSELIVEWEDPITHEVIKDALRTAIENDASRPDDRVYVLRKGGFYWITEPITNSGFTLRIVGEDPGPTELENPAVVQMVARDNGTVNGRMITGGGDMILRNLYFIGADDAGVQTYYQPIQIDASNSRFIIDNCVFERTNFALIAFTASNNDIFFTNCKFRNLIGQPSTQQWEGRGISIWADQDTVVVDNNTFFNLGFTAFQLEGGAPAYLRMNHNTFVNVGRAFNTVSWYREAYIANNLIINGYWHGEGNGDVTSAGRDPRQWFSGMFAIGALPSKYGPEQGRRILFANTAAYRDPVFDAFYADSIRPQWFVGPVTREDYLDVYSNMVVKDTIWLSTRPSLGTYTEDLLDDMIQNINDLRRGVSPAHPWFWNPPADPLVPSWPLPENFTYTDASLLTAGTDGLPLGDLNWFPTQKATYEAGKDQLIAQLEAQAGAEVVYTVVGEEEAESGTLAGGATVAVPAGQTYYRMNAGFLKWTFDMPAAAAVDLNVLVDLNGRGTSGVNFFINNFEIHDTRGWGQYVFGNDDASIYPDFPQTGLNWWLINEAGLAPAEQASHPLNVVAGSNSIEIRASWCDNLFGGVDVLQAGTTTVLKSLTAADITEFSIATPGIVGAPWTPSGFRSVEMGASGSVTLSYDVETAGDYTVQLFYQNVGGDQSAQIKADGANVVTVTLTGNTDSTGLSALSDAFPLAAGSHTITVEGASVKLDYVQLVRKAISTSVKERPGLPEGFDLSQNYPNPFNPMTNIDFDLGKMANVSLAIYNVLGERVATLISNVEMNAGRYTYQFDARNLATGVYFYSLEAGDVKIQKKMLLLK